MRDMPGEGEGLEEDKAQELEEQKEMGILYMYLCIGV